MNCRNIRKILINLTETAVNYIAVIIIYALRIILFAPSKAKIVG